MYLGGTFYSTLVCSAGVGTLEWNSALFLSVEYSSNLTLNHTTTKILTIYEFQKVLGKLSLCVQIISLGMVKYPKNLYSYFVFQL